MAIAALSQIGPDMSVKTLVDNFEGRKLNAPNDLVYRSDGTLYFTDPPYGLPLGDDDPMKELPFNGVFKLSRGKLELIINDLTRPNGIAFSPDERTLYVSNSDEKRRIWMRYDVAADGTVSNGSVLFDATADKESGVPDGLKIDVRGNIWATAPSAVYVLLARRNTAGHDQAAGGSCQLRVGRRRPLVLHHGGNRSSIASRP